MSKAPWYLRLRPDYLLMSPIPNGRLIFNERPTGQSPTESNFLLSYTDSSVSGFPVPGQTTVYDNTQTIDPDTVPLDGGILIKTLVFSIDPSIRGKMRVRSCHPAAALCDLF